MKIVLVLDQYDNENNGTTISAARFAETLRGRGHKVVVISTGEPRENKFVVPTGHLGILQPLVDNQGTVFAKPDDAVIRRALVGADIVHLYLPYKLCMRTREIAHEMGIPCIAAFHCQPENVSYNVHLKYLKPMNHILYRWFRRRFYRYVDDIHCPTEFIADQLVKHNYKANLHVITNGCDAAFAPRHVEKRERLKGKFTILMVGRLSAEKRQDIIIKAALKSKYKDKIQLIFLGKGPKRKYYERIGAKLPHAPIFDYMSKLELADLYNECDLYVHAAEAEIEAIACIEAFASGLVPVIANAKMSATKQFALDERSLFKNRSSKDLAGKIDYWVENESEKARMSLKYIQSARQYTVKKAVDKIEVLYDNVIKQKKYADKHASDPNAHKLHMPTPFTYKVDENFAFINKNIFFRLGSTVLFYLIAIPLLDIVARLWFGLRIKGHKKLRYVKGGAVTVTNHIHLLDSPMVACGLFPKKAHMVTLRTNFEIPIIRWLVRMLGGVPIPETPKALNSFMESMRRELKDGRIVHFYPEASLWPWHDELRPFKNGAFNLAIRSDVPVVPMVFKFRKAWWPFSMIHKKPLVTLEVGDPQPPPREGSEKQRILNLRDQTFEYMQKMLSGGSKKAKKNIV